ncbi:MAG: OmpA family protein [Bacteroidota bacterium]
MKWLFYIFTFLAPPALFCQNLLANGDFEELNTCPEYGTTCAPEAWFRLPPNNLNIITREGPEVFEGNYSELIVVENKDMLLVRRVFLYTMLLCPLEEGVAYQMSFQLNPVSDENFQLGVLFSETELVSGIHNPLRVSPSVLVTKEQVLRSDPKTNWREITFTYTARGGEQFLMFGNFTPSPLPFYQQRKADNYLGDIVYLIDAVRLTPVEPTDSLPCPQAAAVKKSLYANNHRHTYKWRIRPPSAALTQAGSSGLLRSSPTAPPLPKKEKKLEIPDIAFDFDRSYIKKTFFDKLDTLIMEIKAFNPEEIQIIGYTDNIGSDDYNFRLSKKRAVAVREYLRRGFDNYRGKVLVDGRGEENPKVDNSTPENRAVNRRVEITLIK